MCSPRSTMPRSVRPRSGCRRTPGSQLTLLGAAPTRQRRCLPPCGLAAARPRGGDGRGTCRAPDGRPRPAGEARVAGHRPGGAGRAPAGESLPFLAPVISQMLQNGARGRACGDRARGTIRRDQPALHDQRDPRPHRPPRGGSGDDPQGDIRNRRCAQSLDSRARPGDRYAAGRGGSRHQARRRAADRPR